MDITAKPVAVGEKLAFRCQKKCGWCCQMIIRMDYDLVRRNMAKFQVKPTKILDVGDTFAINTADGKCIFLNRKTKDCVIQDDKPTACQQFGNSDEPSMRCPFRDTKSKERKSAEEVERVKTEIQPMIDDSWPAHEEVSRAKEVQL